MSKSTAAARSKARRFALQALYQMKLSGCSAGEAECQLCVDYDMKRVDTDYLHQLLVGIQAHRSDLTSMLESKTVRNQALCPVELAALLIGSFELTHQIDVPYRVVINEGVALSRKFGAAESYKMVNAILDQVAKQYRSAEYGRR